jgi:hypothetical protein
LPNRVQADALEKRKQDLVNYVHRLERAPSELHAVLSPQSVHLLLAPQHLTIAGGHAPAELQAADRDLHSSITTATPHSPSSSRVMRGFIVRGRSLGRMAPPSLPSFQPDHHQRSSPTSSVIQQQQQQQPQPGYPTVPVGPTDERYAKRRRLDDGQSPSGPSIAQQQQQQIAGYPTQQYQSQAQAHWYGSGAQPTNAPISQPSQQSSGYSPTFANPSYGQPAHPAHPAHAPTRNPSVYAAPIPTAPSQWTNGDNAQGQEQYYYHSAHAAYPQVEQMQPYQQQPYTSLIPVGLADGPSPHVPPHLTQANLTAPGDSNASVGGTGTMGKPTSSNQHLGPSRSDRTNGRQVSKPCKRPTPGAHKTRPVTYEGSLLRLQQRCRRQGADEGAIGLLGKVFANEVSLEALTRQLTDAEVERREFGVETGSVYIALLETTNEEEGVVARYVCRLCHSDQTWKHSRDALRHLRRDHFGLADDCDQWYVFGRSLMLMSINVLFGDIAVKSSTPKGK